MSNIQTGIMTKLPLHILRSNDNARTKKPSSVRRVTSANSFHASLNVISSMPWPGDEQIDLPYLVGPLTASSEMSGYNILKICLFLLSHVLYAATIGTSE
ncbi:8245_t:CDS:2 [Paraglomus brasilianum]|uniref:8245_t:CDS:1 n=1 Tax=Paraglomus brasilianum TaxID=144538 RepID=A0A9N9FBP2_9GLOM|nr:8245_t:CDS:2 [Paraglomus brasilianum]